MLKKPILPLLIFTLMIATSVISASAHSPSEMELDYDKDDEILKVLIKHSVSDNESHFIQNIKVEVNGQEKISKDYASQPDKTEFTYAYDLTAKGGDEITVTADCNQGGDLSETLTIPLDEDEHFIPGFIGISAISIISILSLVFIVLKKSHS